MTLLKRTLLTLILSQLVLGCSDTQDRPKTSDIQTPVQTELSEENKQYMKQYSGGYTIEVKNVPSTKETEAYALKENGKAVWMYLISDGKGGATVQQERNGNWTATKNNIVITINGNMGPIIEKYKMKNGKFTETTFSDRYLQQSK